MSWKDFKFHVISNHRDISDLEPGTGYLVRGDWDDYGYKTAFSLTVFALDGSKVKVGSLQIAELEGEKGPTRLPQTFRKLGSGFVSLGMQSTYYENLRSLPEAGWRHILEALADMAYSEERWKFACDKHVVTTSLLRGVPTSLVEGQYRRIAQGGKFQTAYDFSYRLPKRSSTGGPVKLSFEVDPDSLIPTNVHVIIGRNGVGKSYLFDLMTKALLAKRPVAAQSGKFFDHSGNNEALGFTGLALVSFSAFDHFEPVEDAIVKTKELNYVRIGLVDYKKPSKKSGTSVQPKTSRELESEFAKSGKEIISRGRITVWQAAVRKLESDPGFSDLNISGFLDLDNYLDTSGATPDNPVEFLPQFLERASELFRELSSGHKIVLLVLTRLIECVEEKTLVLIDEPEGHLHPPLLSAFIRVLSDLMSDFNGLAIVATHSPVVLQEVPSRCVTQMERYGGVLKVSSPDHETFGENVGVLTSRVFQQEVTDSGFYSLIKDIAQKTKSYDDAMEELGGELGSEARAILMGLTELYKRREG